MNRYTTLDVSGYEQVVRCDNPTVGFTAWIAIHNSNRGPALGGCRVWNYEEEESGLVDVLRLSRAMTYKNALAMLPLGGGKSVVHTDLQAVNRKELFEAFGVFVDSMQGHYITAEDVNSTLEDMAIIKTKTSHVATVGGSGNPSPFTAYGVYCAIRASVRHRFNKDRLDGMTVALQGIGETGGRLAQMLYKDNCRLVVADINEKNIKALHQHASIEVVSPETIYTTPCDIFSPCALGGTLNEKTIPLLRCSIVAGSANNQLMTEKDGWLLYENDILYAPDYAINAGGVINISCEIGHRYDAKRARRLTRNIGETVANIFHLSEQEKVPTNVIADRLAEERFQVPTTVN